MCETRITVYGKDIFIHIELQSIQIVMDDLIVDINAYDKSVSVNFDPIKKVTIYHDYIDIIDELYKYHFTNGGISGELYQRYGGDLDMQKK